METTILIQLIKKSITSQVSKEISMVKKKKKKKHCKCYTVPSFENSDGIKYTSKIFYQNIVA